MCTTLGFAIEDQDARAAYGAYEAGCHFGDALGCVGQGRLLLGEHGIAPDYPRAQQLFVRACNGQLALGCAMAGLLFLEGEGGVPQDLKQAERYLSAGCTADIAAGCGPLGVLYAQREDYKRALPLLQRGCEAEFSVSCAVLGDMYYSGAGVRQDRTVALRLLEQACKDEHLPACTQLGVGLRTGAPGVPANPGRSTKMLEYACNKGNSFACSQFGWSLVHGIGAHIDRRRGMKLLRQGCKDDETGCAMLSAVLLSSDSDHNERLEGLRIAEENCSKENPISCFALTLALRFRSLDASHSLEATVQKIRSSCTPELSLCRSSEALLNLMGRGTPKNLSQAVRLFDQACQEGERMACWEFALLTSAGRGVPRNRVAAVTLLSKQCDAQHWDSCLLLADHIEVGAGVPKDLARARAIYRRACENGEQEACIEETPKGPPIAKLEKQCRGDNTKGCRRLADNLAQGGQKHALDRARRLYEQGCEAADHAACARLANLHLQGIGVPKNVEQARKLLDQTCYDEGGGACFLLGQMHWRGEGVPQDATKARKLVDIGCGYLVPNACTMVKKMEREAPPPMQEAPSGAVASRQSLDWEIETYAQSTLEQVGQGPMTRAGFDMLEKHRIASNTLR